MRSRRSLVLIAVRSSCPRQGRGGGSGCPCIGREPTAGEVIYSGHKLYTVIIFLLGVWKLLTNSLQTYTSAHKLSVVAPDARLRAALYSPSSLSRSSNSSRNSFCFACSAGPCNFFTRARNCIIFLASTSLEGTPNTASFSGTPALFEGMST